MPDGIGEEAESFHLHLQGLRNRHKGRKNCGWNAEYKANYGSLVDRQAQFVFASNTRELRLPHIYTSSHLHIFEAVLTRIDQA